MTNQTLLCLKLLSSNNSYFLKVSLTINISRLHGTTVLFACITMISLGLYTVHPHFLLPDSLGNNPMAVGGGTQQDLQKVFLHRLPQPHGLVWPALCFACCGQTQLSSAGETSRSETSLCRRCPSGELFWWLHFFFIYELTWTLAVSSSYHAIYFLIQFFQLSFITKMINPDFILMLTRLG